MTLIAHYRLDGNATDSIGDNDGTPYNMAYIDGKLGQAGDFNGSDRWIDCGNLGTPYTGSLSLWYKKPTTGTYYLMDGRGTGNWWFLTHYNGYDVNFLNKVRYNGIPLDEWHHVVVTATPLQTQMFIDGVLVDAGSGLSIDFRSVRIGVRYTTSGHMLGQIDDVRIYDHALSEREVRDLSLGQIVHYKMDDDFTDSVGNHVVTSHNNVTWGEGKFGKAASFNGTDSYARIDDSLDLNGSTRTFTLWMKKTSAGSNYNCALHRSTSTAVGASDIWIGYSEAGYLVATIGANSGVGWDGGETTVVEQMNVWYFMAVSWDGSTVRVYVDGELEKTYALTSLTDLNTYPIRFGASSDGANYQFGGLVDDARIYSMELPATEIKELYQQRGSIDSIGNFHSPSFIEASSQGNILDYTTWTAGTTGSESGFSRNGSDSENYRIVDTGPQGNDITVWEARPGATSGADGGWNGSYHSIDNTKLHRFSVWIRRTVQGNGSFYFGTNGGGSAVLNRSNGASNSNPYFDAGGWGWSAGEWVLFVGHVWPVGSGTGGEHPDSGVYTVAGGRIGNINVDYVCASGTTSLRHRSYLYYSTDTTTRQQFCYPRMEVVDGSEPSVEDLLYGLDERWETASFPDNMSIREQAIVPSQSELGVTRGLVAYYPLMGDTKDYADTNDGVNNGATATAEGYEFDRSNWIIADSLTSTDLLCETGKTWSVMAMFNHYGRVDAGVDSVMGASGGFGGSATFAVGVDEQSRIRVVLRGNSSYPFSSVIENQWFFVCIRWDGSQATAIINGNVPQTLGVNTVADQLQGFGIGNHRSTTASGGTNGVPFNGKIKDVRYYDKVLTEEEVALEHKRLMNDQTKVSMTEDCLYINGQFKEVTS